MYTIEEILERIQEAMIDFYGATSTNPNTIEMNVYLYAELVSGDIGKFGLNTEDVIQIFGLEVRVVPYDAERDEDNIYFALEGKQKNE